MFAKESFSKRYNIVPAASFGASRPREFIDLEIETVSAADWALKVFVGWLRHPWLSV